MLGTSLQEREMAGRAEALIAASRKLAESCNSLVFSNGVTHVYNPLNYARKVHEEYLRRFGRGKKRVVFWGMNPGPWGMAQTGVPFGEIAAVRDWMGIEEPVDAPPGQHPAKPVLGFLCPRSEVSGRRFWGLMTDRFGKAAAFFKNHFVANYCPLLFLEEGGRNRTPDKLSAGEKTALFRICNEYMRQVIDILDPLWVLGIGKFAVQRIRIVRAAGESLKIGGILHPSPASPQANRGWSAKATRQLTTLGVW